MFVIDLMGDGLLVETTEEHEDAPVDDEALDEAFREDVARRASILEIVPVT